MKRANAKSESESHSAARAAMLEEVVRLTGKDPLLGFAEAAHGRLQCTGCNGAGYIERETNQKTIDNTYIERTECKRCQGTKREKVPATAILNAQYKLARFFYAQRKAVETSESEAAPPERFVTLRFDGPDGEEEPERG
jgi:hypothetical protein